MGQADEFISALVVRTRKLNLAVDRSVLNKHHIQETEVTQSTVKNTNIDQLLLDIERSESMLMTEPDLENLRALIALYQKVVVHNYKQVGE